MKVRMLNGEEFDFPTAVSGGVEHNANGPAMLTLRDSGAKAIAFFRYDQILGYWFQDAKPEPAEPKPPELKPHSTPAGRGKSRRATDDGF